MFSANRLLKILAIFMIVMLPLQEVSAFWFLRAMAGASARGSVARGAIRGSTGKTPPVRGELSVVMNNTKPLSVTMPKNTLKHTRTDTAKQQWKEKNRSERARKTVANADKPLEPTNPKMAQYGHGHEKHGYQVTSKQQKKRITDEKKKIVSKFHNPKLEAEALGRGRKQLNQELSEVDKLTGQSKIPKFDEKGNPSRITVKVGTNNPKGYGIAHERKLDSNGNYIPKKSNTPQKHVNILYEYLPSKNTWEPVTYYPIK